MFKLREDKKNIGIKDKNIRIVIPIALGLKSNFFNYLAKKIFSKKIIDK